LGVFIFTWIIVKSGWARLPDNTTWMEIYGVAILCGIGFTMSLFLGTLTFQSINPVYLIEVRLGVLIGSLLSGLAGAAMLQLAFSKKAKKIL
jgi:Na+:H+ antiporter, NhaA family